MFVTGPSGPLASFPTAKTLRYGYLIKLSISLSLCEFCLINFLSRARARVGGAYGFDIVTLLVALVIV